MVEATNTIIELGNVPALLADLDVTSTERITTDIHHLLKAGGVLKERGLQLGASLKEVREQLKKQKRWIELVAEIASLTGYSPRQIRRWVDGETGAKAPSTTTSPKPFDREREVKAFCKRLNAGTESLISDATEVVRQMATALGLQVKVSIELV